MALAEAAQQWNTVTFDVRSSEPVNNDIKFVSNAQEVMRISQDGITIKDGVSVSEAAQGVIDVLQAYIEHVFEKKNAEIEMLRAQIAKLEDY